MLRLQMRVRHRGHPRAPQSAGHTLAAASPCLSAHGDKPSACFARSSRKHGPAIGLRAQTRHVQGSGRARRSGGRDGGELNTQGPSAQFLPSGASYASRAGLRRPLMPRPFH
ncbi:hypothetical protein PsYK624_169420 [Phanerochaete sordida]|uniref:Uncharacterized protein n=1 Tax=Phanerochaete sordida TaxID=48140 RepID=A0A9P3LMP7_9APHY|nr:hypothetical protein PsYK624_169420 [Phanerochaete sordida]